MNGPRSRLLLRVIEEIVGRRDWHPLDAVLFPGCFFRLAEFIGHLDLTERDRAIERNEFAATTTIAAAVLQSHSPGALVIVGADSTEPFGNENGDQMCIAFGPVGVVGSARKIFPADLDTRECWWPITPDVRDYSAPGRFVKLANEQRAVLAACYDLFGLTETVEAPSMRTRAIRYLRDGDDYREAGAREFRELRARCIADWRKALKAAAPTVGLAAIHAFKRPGSESYWQRHGVANASAALGGGLAVGAAHFHELLPDGDEAPLAAASVKRAHLGHGAQRGSQCLDSEDSFRVIGKGLPVALVRVFEG